MPNRRLAASAIVLVALLSAAVARADLPKNSLVKSPDSPSVYFLGSDGKRYVIPDERTYRSWFLNFKDVATVTSAELQSHPIGGNVTFRPGVRMVKIATDPKTYVVDSGARLRWVKTEEVARALYGSD